MRFLRMVRKGLITPSPSRFCFSSSGKRVFEGRGIHTPIKKCLVLLSTDVGCYNFYGGTRRLGLLQMVSEPIVHCIVAVGGNAVGDNSSTNEDDGTFF